MTALVLSIVGVVLAVASLGWQAWTWRRSGPRVVVTTANAFPVYSGRTGEWHIAVKATNTGRSPITIDGWGFELPDKSDIVLTQPVPWLPQLPHRLDSYTEASWMMDGADFRSTCARRSVSVADARPWVRAAGLGKIYSKGGVPLKD
jgi:hypothetical protein